MSYKELKFFILFNFSESNGGGSVFLNLLMKKFKSKGLLCEDPADADVIIFNSHHKFYDLIKLKFKYPKKLFIHRIDGPISTNREYGSIFDNLIYKFNFFIADASIFQSNWSLSSNVESGFKSSKQYKIIHNSTDSEIFNQEDRISFDQKNKCKLIASSWSYHPNKGLDILEELDKRLDFDTYEMIFIGNKNYKFQNINNLGVMSNKMLGNYLKASDIYISASKIEACSNSLIEAVSCGLPSITRNCSSNNEIVRDKRLLYSNIEELLFKLDEVKSRLNIENNYEYNIKNIDSVAKEYAEFSHKVFLEKINNKINFFIFMKLLTYLVIFKSFFRLKLASILKFLIR